MCLSIILTRPLSPNVGYVFLCVPFHPHLIFSPLMKAQSLPLLPPNIAFLLLSFRPDELFSLILTLIYFCSLLPLPSFCLTSFSPWPGLIQLLLPRPSCSAALSSICSPPSSSLPFNSLPWLPFLYVLLLLCIFVVSMLHLLQFLPCSFSPSSYCPMYLS